MKNNHDSGAPSASTERVSPPQFEPSVATRKRCKGTKKNGTACTAWAMEGCLCYFHANPDKASELGKRGGKAKSPTGTPGVFEYVARPLKSVDDVTKLLADTINDLRSGAIDSRLANTVGYLATGVLKALQQGGGDSYA